MNVDLINGTTETWEGAADFTIVNGCLYMRDEEGTLLGTYAAGQWVCVYVYPEAE